MIRLPRVTAREFAPGGDRARAPDTDPEHPQAVKRRQPPLLGRRAAEEHLVKDDPGAAARHRGDTRDPRCLQRAERRPDDDLAVRSELDTRLLRGRGHRLDQGVRSEGEPWIRQDGLQAPGDAGLSRTGPAVENDHLSRHRATVPAVLTVARRQGSSVSNFDMSWCDRRYATWPDYVIRAACRVPGSGGAATRGRFGAVGHNPALYGAMGHNPRTGAAHLATLRHVKSRNH